MTARDFVLRAYAAADEDAAIDLWHRTWQQAYPDIDFAARLDWWRTRWRTELVPQADVVLAVDSDALLGFVTVEPATGELDQIVVAPEAWGGGVAEALLGEAKRRSPGRLTLRVNVDNVRAIRFYEKQGFVRIGEDVNPTSRRPIYVMGWTAGAGDAGGTAS